MCWCQGVLKNFIHQDGHYWTKHWMAWKMRQKHFGCFYGWVLTDVRQFLDSTLLGLLLVWYVFSVTLMIWLFWEVTRVWSIIVLHLERSWNARIWVYWENTLGEIWTFWETNERWRLRNLFLLEVWGQVWCWKESWRCGGQCESYNASCSSFCTVPGREGSQTITPKNKVENRSRKNDLFTEMIPTRLQQCN